jgi:cytochrome b561
MLAMGRKTPTERALPDLTNSESRGAGAQSYGRGAIAFHWTAALLVAWVGMLGLLHDSWPKRLHLYWINIHALFGLALWLLVVARFCWRMAHPVPSLPANIGTLYRYFSWVAHLALYALLFITPIVGIVTFIWHGRRLNLGLFAVNFGIVSNRAVFEPSEDLHGYLAYALFALAAVHISAALWHHFVRRDGILARMWPSAAAARSTSVQTGRRGGAQD